MDDAEGPVYSTEDVCAQDLKGLDPQFPGAQGNTGLDVSLESNEAF